MGAFTRGLPLVLHPVCESRLMVLVYHRVLPEPDFMRPEDPDVACFDWQMELLARHLRPLSLAEAVRGLEQGNLPPRAVCVTFDDGYTDNLTLAVPVLQRWNIPATVFVATGFLNGGRMFNDTIIEALRRLSGPELDLGAFELPCFSLQGPVQRHRSAVKILRAIKYREPTARQAVAEHIGKLAGSLPGDLMLDDEQLRELVGAGVEIGAHTVNHPILASLDLAWAKREVERGKRHLESLIDREVRFFAYPNGQPGRDFLPSHRDLLPGLGFAAAFTNERGVASSTSDRFMLPRFTPWDRTPLRFMARLLFNCRNVV